MLILSFLVAAFAVLLLFLALLVAHRTPMPKLSQPGMLWWPGVVILFAAPVLAVMPQYMTYSDCEARCDVIDGRPVDIEYAKNVAKDYASCVKNSVSEVRRTNEEMKLKDPEIDVEAVVAAARPGAEETCFDLVAGTCVNLCYDPTEGLGE